MGLLMEVMERGGWGGGDRDSDILEWNIQLATLNFLNDLLEDRLMLCIVLSVTRWNQLFDRLSIY